MFENPRGGRQARNFTKNVSKILDLKSSSEQIFSESCRWVPLTYERFIQTLKERKIDRLAGLFKLPLQVPPGEIKVTVE